MPDYSLADIAAATGNGGNNNGNNGGFGDGNGAWWLLVLFALLGGFGNNGNGGGRGGYQGGGYPMMYGAGFVGGNELYPWLNNAENINGGFRDQMIQTGIQGINTNVQNLATQLCNCCGDIQMALANGFAGVNQALCSGFNGVNMAMMQGFNGVEQGANARQMANMQQQFTSQMATMQGFNGLQAQLADCCCENRLATANQTATILAEHCADRAALSDGVRDIIASSQAGTQLILDKLCAQELDAERRENANLRQQLQMADLRASQVAQTAQILQGQNNEVDALYQRLATCPVGTMPVYGNQPIFTCPQNQYQGCGCGCN